MKHDQRAQSHIRDGTPHARALSTSGQWTSSPIIVRYTRESHISSRQRLLTWAVTSTFEDRRYHSLRLISELGPGCHLGRYNTLRQQRVLQRLLVDHYDTDHDIVYSVGAGKGSHR